MDIRYSANQKDVKRYTTEELRKEFLIQDLYAANEVHAVYSHVDRMVTLGCMPTTETVSIDKGIDCWKNFGTDYFLERREIGIFNIGGAGFRRMMRHLHWDIRIVCISQRGRRRYCSAVMIQRIRQNFIWLVRRPILPIKPHLFLLRMRQRGIWENRRRRIRGRSISLFIQTCWRPASCLWG